MLANISLFLSAPPPHALFKSPMERHVGPPHGVEQRALLCDPQQLVRHGHVVGDGLLAVVEEGVGSPDLAGHQVIETQHGHGPFEL